MSNRVYTYNKINELKTASYFTEIAPFPQITMSREMATQMTYDMRVFKGNTLAFTSFAAKLFPGWNSSSQRFVYVTILNQFMREKIAKAKDKAERDWLYGCKKNTYAAIVNIIKFEEAGIRPEDITEKDRDMLLFLEMWNRLIKASDSIEAFRSRLLELKDPKTFDEEVNKIFKFHGKKIIVWHGFQFLTPIQQIVYDGFINAGYDIYALIQDDVRYPYANEIWNHLYNETNGYPSKEKWIRQDTGMGKNALGEIFETGKEAKADNIKIIRYNNTIEFVEDVERIKEEGFYLYSADDTTANNLLRDYYPEKYDERNLLAYPIGQFIYTLHKMWDESLQCITLSPDGLRKCFASGWLSAHGKSSINYTDDLERLLPYFEGCYTTEEWNERLGVLSDGYDNVYDVFAGDGEDSKKEQRKKDILGNPLKNFSIFSIKESRIGDVIDIIGQLIEMASSLFGKNEPVSIQQHIAKLDAMLYMNDGMPKELFIEEREKVREIFKALESEKIRDFLCYPGDLASALTQYIGGGQEDTEKNNKGLTTLVFNIFQIESAPIGAKGKVHLCLSDISRLPGSVGKYSWPVDEKLLIDINERKTGTYLINWIESGNIIALSNRYYTYAALKNDVVEISWIKQQGEKLFSPSPYITLLDKLSNVKIMESNVRNLDLQYVSNVYANKRLERTYDVTTNRDLYVHDAELEYAICPMRFVYSHILGETPTYRNEYQQYRAMVRLIQIIKKLLGTKYSVEQIAEQVFELFPYIRKAEKRQMIDDATRWAMPEPDESYTVFGEKKYTNLRYNLTFMEKDADSYARHIASLLMSQEGRKDIFHDNRGGGTERNCEFCPHEGYCMKSLFGRDYKGAEQ